ncbi:hypothetical protein AVEN_239065-1 [Araneus ventricosus]|uniref:Uncharacterized protein n=1 Tax=Araneus ventricosus TaxID=182803 RepID=A0A4Y2ILW8_ARAVE|nr:hypothetical protein AVEN_239065-1 [Araneus ventricosus]
MEISHVLNRSYGANGKGDFTGPFAIELTVKETDYIDHDAGLFCPSVGRRHFFRTLTTGKVTSPNSKSRYQIEPLSSNYSQNGIKHLENLIFYQVAAVIM